jgi:hypothetical protein
MPSFRRPAAALWPLRLRRSALLTLHLSAEIPAPFLLPCVALLRRPATLQLALHALRPSAAARVGHDMRQRDKRPALLFGALRALGLLLLMLDGGRAKFPRLDRRWSPPAPPPSVAAAVPTPPLLRRGRRRFWLRLGDQRKLINKLPTGAPPVQLAPQLRPRVRLRRRRGFGLRRFFGAAGLGRPECAPLRSA